MYKWKRLSSKDEERDVSYFTDDFIRNKYYIPESRLMRYPSDIDYELLCSHQLLGEDFIREYSEYMEWSFVLMTQKLSLSFIKHNLDDTAFSLISRYQKLPESFIREYASKLNWEDISQYQELSEEFIREFLLKLNLDLLDCSKLSDQFVSEFKHLMPWHVLYRRFCMPSGYEEAFSDHLQVKFYDEE